MSPENIESHGIAILSPTARTGKRVLPGPPATDQAVAVPLSFALFKSLAMMVMDSPS